MQVVRPAPTVHTTTSDSTELGDSALLNRMATVHYTKEPPQRKSSYKSEDPQKNPILRHEMGAQPG